MRRGQHAVGQGGLLRLAVVEVGEGEGLLLGPDLHVLERVAQVGVAQLVEPDGERVVRRDGDEGDALVLVVGVQLLDAVLVGLGRRAVVAGEDDDQHLGVGEVLQGVGLAVHARQGEVRGGVADGERFEPLGLGGGRPDGQGEQGEGGEESDGCHGSCLLDRGESWLRSQYAQVAAAAATGRS